LVTVIKNSTVNREFSQAGWFIFAILATLNHENKTHEEQMAGDCRYLIATMLLQRTPPQKEEGKSGVTQLPLTGYTTEHAIM
jgi:hypothetical protein